jgi:hypothetical protein
MGTKQCIIKNSPEFKKLQEKCGCVTCDCDAGSQDSYHKGCHTYGLFDQEGDASNSNESAGVYDESEGPTIKGKYSKGQENNMSMEEFEFLHMNNSYIESISQL